MDITLNGYKDAKSDLSAVFHDADIKIGNADYVVAWVKKAAPLAEKSQVESFAFVTTNSLYEGEQAEILLWLLERYRLEIEYAHTSFRWSNNASKNAGVTCCITKVCDKGKAKGKKISDGENVRAVRNIGPYLVEMPQIVVKKSRFQISGFSEMAYGSMSNDNGQFTIPDSRYRDAISKNPRNTEILRIAVGGQNLFEVL